MIHAIIFMAALFLPPAVTQATELSGEALTGYEWARDNGIEDPHSCATESAAFNEGCLSFIAQTKEPAADEAAQTPPATDNLPAGFDFPDDEFTILE